MTKLEDQYKALMDALKPWEILIFTRTEDWRSYKWEWDKTWPNWKWKWVNDNGDVFGWYFVNWVANWDWFVKLDWKEFYWVWENAVMKSIPEWDEWSVTFHIQDLNFDNITEKLIYQKNEDWEVKVFQFK